MSIRIKVEFTADACLITHQTENENKPAGLDTLWEDFDNSSQPIDFTEKFLEHISNEVGVEISSTEPIKQYGSQNTHYMLQDCNGKKYIMRMGGNGLPGEPEGRMLREFEILKQLEGLCSAGFKVYFLDSSKRFTEYHYLVGEFIEGKTIGLADPFTIEEVTSCAKLLREIHAIDVNTLRERKYPEGSYLYAPLDEAIPALCIGNFLEDATKQKVREACQDVIPLLKHLPIGITHHDYFRGNIIQTESGYRLVDWEWSNVSYLAMDIGIYLCQQFMGMTTEHAILFLSEYGYGQTEEEMTIIWFFWVKRLVFLIWFFHTQMSMEAGAAVCQSCCDLLEDTLRTRRIPGL